ncbi:hydrolase [Paenibacillus baekrokdamisoli]|uniref:Hydrolase n=1 Tax=Paenibacillus baekrokdamisoli TaxID=1712516 RepID=A0A3G9J7G0_9BACL|nr:SGNH/GDSL hydrolase family protein [Paenibacillus baekrokdamisoli]MBB3067070.1 lysophospholipase L1-like esterase [Paenibacillus baekrokdamisoli]BBH19738.1 hydrolase [Paenibacillus baekrokdamisoli]
MPDQPKPINAIKLDSNMSIKKNGDDSLKWLSPLEAPFQIAGFAWLDHEKKYRRLPSSPKDPLPPAVDALANCTAGGQIRFITNSSNLSIRVKLTGPADMYHMPATGQCGFDCYLGEPGNQHFLSTTSFDHLKSEYEALLYNWKTKREFCVTLNFPLYQGVEEVLIGVDEDAHIISAPQYASKNPIVIYGTSITQGGCATRPGMAYTNILSRSIPLEFINLGFSGSGRGEAEVARTVADIPNPALLVLDYEANSGTVEEIASTLPSFIRILRERHPIVPIIVISKIHYSGDRFYQDMLRLHEDRKEIQKTTVERLRSEGDRNIHFVDGFTLLGEEDAEECTVDGVHPTDLGFKRMAQSLEPIFRELLKEWL